MSPPTQTEHAEHAGHAETPRLRALFLNCTLKPSPKMSHTDGLIFASQQIMEANNVEMEAVRPVDYDIAPGVQPDMTEDGFETDEWPELYKKVEAADILVITTPIWLGEMSSVCVRTIERLYAQSGQTNEKGQYVYYGKVGGCLITGNEDGGKHCARSIIYSLMHLGCVIPPQADAYWLGEAGPGESYRTDGSPGPDNDFTNRMTTFMTWNLIHLGRMLKAGGGLPSEGNSQEAWSEGERFGHPGAGAIRGLEGGPSAG